MNDREKAPVAAVEKGHLDFETAHSITAPFIVMPDYGTRCTTVVLLGSDGMWHVTERRFDSTGQKTGESRMSFQG
jgi:uncharacterized protein with NRDE domain